MLRELFVRFPQMYPKPKSIKQFLLEIFFLPAHPARTLSSRSPFV